jgi:hypothetical protein
MSNATLAKNQYIDVNDLVTLTNIGTETYTGYLESREYECEPGGTIYIPFYLAVKDFGDPRSQPGRAQNIKIRGQNHYIPNRESEVARLCTKYGIYVRITGEGLREAAPKVQLKDQSGGEITTVLDDFKGNSYLPASPEQINERDMLEARLAQITARLDAIDHDDHVTLNTQDAEDDVEEDKPPDFSNSFRGAK